MTSTLEKPDIFRLYDDAVGTAEITLPQTWSELFVQVYINSSNMTSYHLYEVQTNELKNA